MDEAQQDQYEERLKEVFQSFDSSGSGSLCPEELSELCQALHLEEATPVLLGSLLQSQDNLTGRVDFEQFKDALILVLSKTVAGPLPSQSQETYPKPDSPEVHPKFVKGGKRYGRRSTPELADSITGFSGVLNTEQTNEDSREAENSTVPRKRERWHANADGTEEYEAEGQLHLWNPDELGTPRGSGVPLSDRLEERLRVACEDLGISWDGCATRHELLSVCEHAGLEVTEDVFQRLDSDELMNVQELMSWILNHSKPPTPSASTPYRQLKRHHSTQPFDETGRRIATPSAMPSTIGLRLFTSLDDGTGHTQAEEIVDAWLDEGIENSPQILQALDFSLDAKVNLSELTVALENELLVTKNGIQQAALASFKAEIRYLLECVDRELREKEKLRMDLEKAEKLKTQLATEVDEHHYAIERMNDLNLRKLELDNREKLAAVRAELTKEMDLIQQQANQQREELEKEMDKIKEEAAFLRDHLSLTIKENGRLESELLESTEKLVDAENLICKLQRNLDNILKERFGDLDPGSAEFFMHEERLRQLRSDYEEQCRDLQDRIDELQAELEEYQTLGRTPHPLLKPSLSEEFDSKSPGIESDQGLGSEECQPFNMSLEAEMLVEQMKVQHLREVESIKAQLESKIRGYQQKVEEEKAAYDALQCELSLKCQEEVQALKEEMSLVQDRVKQLQNNLDQEQSDRRLEQSQANARAELETQHEEEVNFIKEELLEAQAHAANLEEQLKTLELHQTQIEQSLAEEREALRRQYGEEQIQLEEHHKEVLKEERARQQFEREELAKRLLDDWETEKAQMQRSHEEMFQGRLEEEKYKFLTEFKEQERRLMEGWEMEKTQLQSQHKGALEEERLSFLKEKEDSERKLTEQWEMEKAELLKNQEKVFQARLVEEMQRLKEQQDEAERRLTMKWERERAQLEKYYEGVLQTRLDEEGDKLQGEREKQEKQLIEEFEKERAQLEENHREAMQELSAKHSEERERLSGLLDKLRGDIAEERKDLENHFSQRIKEVEARFSGDQEAVSERFQMDVSKLEHHYQSELRDLSERHAEEKTKWESEMEEAIDVVEKQKRVLCEVFAVEKESITLKLMEEQELLEERHKKEVKAFMDNNQDLQNKLEKLDRAAQMKEIELSRQLNDLHNRLQENLDTRDELLAESEKKILDMEQLLRQAVDDFDQEKAELQDSLNDLEIKNEEILTMVNKEMEEKEKQLAENDRLKYMIQEMEAEVNQLSELRESFEEMKKEKEAAYGVIALLQKKTELLETELERHISPVKKLSQHLVNVTESVVCEEITAIQEDFLASVEKRHDETEDDNDSDEESASVEGKRLQLENEVEMIANLKEEYDLAVSERDICMQKTVELQDKVELFKARAQLFTEVEVQYDSTVEKNLMLQQQVSQLQQRISELELILENCRKDIAESEQAQKENKCLKEEILSMVEKTKAVATKTSELMDLQVRYEECISENARLGKQNQKLEGRVLSLESKMHVIKDFQDQHAKLEDDMAGIKDENYKLSAQVRELQKQDEAFITLQEAESFITEAMSEETFQDLNAQLEGKIQAVSDLEDCCIEFERQNAKLRTALSNLQDKSLKIHEKMKSHRSEANRLAEENFILKHKISTLKEEDVKETQEEMLLKLQQFKKEKLAAQRMADNFKRQVSELRLQGQQLEDENGFLSHKNAQNAADMQDLNHRMIEILRRREKREAGSHLHAELEEICSSRDLNVDLASAMSRADQLQKENETLNEELGHCVEKLARLGAVECQLSLLLQERKTLDKQTQGLHAQLSAAQEKVQTMDEVLQTVNLQSARLKSDMRVTQQEKEALKQEVILLHKQLQNANDKNQVLEMALHSSGYQNQHKKLYWDELARLVEQEQQLLRQENERLQREVQIAKGGLLQSRDKIRQLEATILSLKQQRQQGQSSLVRAVEQENASLKCELDSLQKEMLTTNRKASETSESQQKLESLRQENEGLKSRLAHLEAQLLEALHAQLEGMMPRAQLRLPGEWRGQHQGGELAVRGQEINLHEEREGKLMKMEERMRDVELKLHNVKLLLQEKVSQLKDQMHKNSKADTMIKDLYVENSQLLKALEMTEQRQKVAEKKNYLLEEKISSLNKIVRDLSPSPLPAVPYRLTRS